MQELLNKLAAYKNEINAENVATKDALEAFRIKYLGTKGLVKNVMGEMKTVTPENKREAGQALNDFKIFIEEKFEAFKNAIGQEEKAASNIDLSLPGSPLPQGTRHPISIVQNKILTIFQRLGFAIAEGPEIEDDWHNFSALNMPQNHPARDMQDTFYINESPAWLLRTHTSSVQIREMEKGIFPLRIICPGRVYRNEIPQVRCFFNTFTHSI